MAKVPDLFEQMGKSGIPDYLADEESNIAPKMSVPSLSYEGKVWTISLNGEKTKLMKKDADGDEVPLGVFRGVILDYAKHRGRTMYEGNYDPGNVSMPLCWSDDGIAPHENVLDPPSDRCATCPNAVKGSGRSADKTKKVAACSQHLMAVVVPATKLDFAPLRMKLAITSVYDKESPEMAAAGWHAFDQYIDKFRANNVPSTAIVVTKMRFDPNVTYPKVMFASDRWLTPEEREVVRPISKSEAVKNLLANRFTPNGADGVAGSPTPLPGRSKAKALPAPKPPLEDEDDAEVIPPTRTKAAKPRPVAEDVEEDEDEMPAAKPKKAKAVVLDDDDEPPVTKPKKAKAVVEEEDEDEDPPPKKTKPKRPPVEEDDVEDDEPPAKKPAKASRKAADEEDEDDTPLPPAKKKAASAPAAAPAKVKKPDTAELDNLLGEWGTDPDEDEKPKKGKKSRPAEDDDDE